MSAILVEDLRKVRDIFVHARCPDGVSSAIILHDALPEARVHYLQYGSDELAKLPATPRSLFCDVTPTPDRAAEFARAGAIVLDHHAGAQELVAIFGKNMVYADAQRDPGVSGALLAHREVWCRVLDPLNARLRERAERFATLAGVRDCWLTNHEDWRTASGQAAALLFYPADSWLHEPYCSDAFMQRLAIAPVLLAQRDAQIARVLSESVWFEVEGLRVLVIATTDTSDAAEHLKERGGLSPHGLRVDVLVGFRYLADWGREGPHAGAPKKKLVLSMRSVSNVIVLPLARALDGSGHARAAGANAVLHAASLEPYAEIAAQLRDAIEYLDSVDPEESTTVERDAKEGSRE